MTLLSPLALLFALAAAVPLLLHLYQRRRRAVIEFSTNRFFTQAITRTQRRLRLRRLLLLMLRMATCVLLALALARPILNRAGLGRAGTRDVAILLDDSLSMQASDDAHRTHFERARDLATDVLHQLAPGDQAAVITFTGRTLGTPTPAGLVWTDDLPKLAGDVAALTPTSAAGDAHAALARAAELFKDASARERHLLVLSDLQETDWRQSDWPTPAHHVAASIVRLAPPTADNVAADELVLSQGTAVAGQPNLLRVRLVNYRPQTTSAELSLRVDDQEYLRRPVELPGGSPHTERIPLTFATPGEHRLKLTVDAHDALPADDTLFATVNVSPELTVLLVDGQAHGTSQPAAAHRSATLYLRAALRAGGGEADTLRVHVIAPADLPGVALDAQRVVIFSDVPELPLPQVERLEQFVQAGGGLAVFLGEELDRSFYNDVLAGASRPLGGLLPAAVGDVLDTAGAERSLSLVAADVAHPVLQRFSGTLRSALAGINVYRAYTLTPRDAWVVAALDGGPSTTDRLLPFIVERSYGRGKVVLFAAPPDPRWTNLPLRRVFLPLINRLASYLAGSGTGIATHAVGEDLVLLRGGWNVDQPVYVLRPDGVRLRAGVDVVGAEPVALLRAEAVTQPGFYQLELPAADGSPRQAQQNSTTASSVLAVNVPRRESIPRTLDLGDARRLAGNWRVEVTDTAAPGGATNEQSLAALLTGGAGGHGVWDTLLWAALLFVLLEPLIANRVFGPRADRAEKRGRQAA